MNANALTKTTKVANTGNTDTDSDTVIATYLKIRGQYSPPEVIRKMEAEAGAGVLVLLPLTLARVALFFLVVIGHIAVRLYFFAYTLCVEAKIWCHSRKEKKSDPLSSDHVLVKFRRTCRWLSSLRPRLRDHCRRAYPWKISADIRKLHAPQKDAWTFVELFGLDPNMIVTPFQLKELSHTAIVKKCKEQRSNEEFEVLSRDLTAKARCMCEWLLEADLGFKNEGFRKWRHARTSITPACDHLRIFFLIADDLSMPWEETTDNKPASIAHPAENQEVPAEGELITEPGTDAEAHAS